MLCITLWLMAGQFPFCGANSQLFMLLLKKAGLPISLHWQCSMRIMLPGNITGMRVPREPASLHTGKSSWPAWFHWHCRRIIRVAIVVLRGVGLVHSQFLASWWNIYRSLALQQEATLFMVLLGAFQILLSRYSGQQQIAVGTPVANRERKEIEGLIGFFANTLVLCLQMEGMPTSRQLLSQIRKTALDAFENQDLPFEELVDELQPERNLNRNPFFQVMFILQNTPRAELHRGEIKLRPFDVENPTAKFDLTLSLSEESGELQGRLSYNAELFKQATVARMIGHYCMLLQEMVEQPEQPVTELSLLTEAELSQLLKWNHTAADYPQKFVHELFEEHAAKTPSAFAVDFEGQQLTYEQLNRRANQLGRHLKKLGAGPDTRVGICMERTWKWW